MVATRSPSSLGADARSIGKLSGGSNGTAATPAIGSCTHSATTTETASPPATGSMRRSQGALSVFTVRASSNPAALTTAVSHVLNAGRQRVACDQPQQVRGDVLLEPKVSLGTLPLQLLSNARRLRTSERRVTDTEKTSTRLRRMTCVVERSVDLGKRPLSALEQRGAGRGQLDSARRANEQHEAELSLQLPNRTRKRRLRHVQTLRRSPDMKLLRHGDEVAQLPQLDRNIHCSGY